MMDTSKQQELKKKMKRIIKKRKDGTIISSKLVEASSSSVNNPNAAQPTKRRSKSLGRKDSKADGDVSRVQPTTAVAKRKSKVSATAGDAKPSSPSSKKTASPSSSSRPQSLPPSRRKSLPNIKRKSLVRESSPEKSPDKKNSGQQARSSTHETALQAKAKSRRAKSLGAKKKAGARPPPPPPQEQQRGRSRLPVASSAPSPSVGKTQREMPPPAPTQNNKALPQSSAKHDKPRLPAGPLLSSTAQPPSPRTSKSRQQSAAKEQKSRLPAAPRSSSTTQPSSPRTNKSQQQPLSPKQEHKLRLPTAPLSSPAQSPSPRITKSRQQSTGQGKTPQLPAAPLSSPAQSPSPRKSIDNDTSVRAPGTPKQTAKQTITGAPHTPHQPDAKSKVVRVRKPKNGVVTLSPSVVRKKKVQAPPANPAIEPPKVKPNPYQTGALVYVADLAYTWMPASIVQYDSQTKTATVEMIAPGHVNEGTLGVKSYATADSLREDGKDEEKKVILEIPNVSPSTLPLPNLDKTGQAIMTMDDMVDLPFLHEAAILFNLKARHVKKLPYTRTGDIVIAVNPYQWISSLYSNEQQLLYARRLVWEVGGTSSSQQSKMVEDARRTVAPHVYEVSAQAYQGLARTGEAQSILVSGESGAGKTETVKICMNHLSLVQSGTVTPNEGNLGGMNPVVKRVVESNPLLEVFGNARTRRNDNSSRFGKYVQLQFDRDDSLDTEKDEDEGLEKDESKSSPGRRKIRARVYGQSAINAKREEEERKKQEEDKKTKLAAKPLPACELVGSVCTVYLLEKSRVVGHDPAERTFHIFYALLAASDKDKKSVWPGLVGKSSLNFAYVGETDHNEWEGTPDSAHYAKTCKALSVIGIAGDALLQLMRAIVIVLQCGQIIFEQTAEDGKDHCVVPSNCLKEFEALSELTGVSGDHLERAFTERTMVTRGETFIVPLSPVGAKDSCDAFAKEVYAKAFLWLVREINSATSAHENFTGTRKASNSNSDFATIGLLDIFGFESFPVNGFEQLCINYANECLQQKFTHDVFKTVEAEYIAEGISLDDVKYDDNSDVLDLIESRNGLLALLEQECVRPKGTAREFVYKARLVKSKCLIADKHNGKVLGPMEFGVQHYAGKVIYYTEMFLQTNQDVISPDLHKMALKSSNDILSKHLTNDAMMKSSKSRLDSKTTGDGKAGKARIKSGTVVDTVWNKFRGQLAQLMKGLKRTKSRYIRCIKPNTLKKPLLMQQSATVEQLRCSGVIAAVAITRSSFPSRLDHKACLDRFQVIFRPAKPFKPRPKSDDTKEELRKVLGQALSDFVKQEQDEDKDNFVVGKTRVYFRAGVLEHLENKRVDCWDLWANDIQRVARGYFVRRVTRAINLAKILDRYQGEGDKATLIQSRWRIILAKKEVKKRKYDNLHGFAARLEQNRSNGITRSPQRKVGKLKINALWT